MNPITPGSDRHGVAAAWTRDQVENLLAERDGLREALERLVADLETNSEAGAPDYAHEALSRV